MAIIRIQDKYELIRTSEFPYAHWPYEEFNPVQSAIFEHISTNKNILVASGTASGKTTMAEMYISDEVRRNGGKAIYIGPMKSLTREKLEDWTNKDSHFSDLKVSICTGDFQVTRSRVKELNESDIICLTPEMLAARCRNRKSDKSSFLRRTGVIVFDEAHVLTVPGRGDHTEIALMKMLEINPKIRIVLLSATLPNVDEVSGWISKITKRDCVLIESKYRPCPLHIHYEPYNDIGSYADKEAYKIGKAIGIVNHYKNDKFLIFAHTKATGRKMVEYLKSYGIDSAFHNGDLGKDKRFKIENDFKNDPNNRVLVATSTLAWGNNLPARRVIILGVHRGVELVPNYDINQEVGRAGRPKYDPRGDAYILVPASKKEETIAMLKEPPRIISQFLKEEGGHYKTLAFHVVSEIHHGNIKTIEQFHEWFNRSLASFQNQMFGDGIIDKTIDLLIKMKAIVWEDGELKTTPIGMIASMFYFSPFDVNDLRRNFMNLFHKKREDNDLALACALGDVDSHRFKIANTAEKIEMQSFQKKVEHFFGQQCMTDGAMKASFGYYNMLNGNHVSEAFESVQNGLRADIERTLEVVDAIDKMSTKWHRHEFLRTLRLRFTYGVSVKYVGLVEIPSVGRTRSERLVNAGIDNLDKFCTKSVEELSSIMKIKDKKAVQRILDEAKKAKMEKDLIA